MTNTDQPDLSESDPSRPAGGVDPSSVASVVHLVSTGRGLTVCCGRSLFELPIADRATNDPRQRTCPDAAIEALVETAAKAEWERDAPAETQQQLRDMLRSTVVFVAERVRAEAQAELDRERKRLLELGNEHYLNWRAAERALARLHAEVGEREAAVRAEAVAEQAKLLSDTFLAERDLDARFFRRRRGRRRVPDYNAGYRMAMEDAARYARGDFTPTGAEGVVAAAARAMPAEADR
jgi:hypothetical protein